MKTIERKIASIVEGLDVGYLYANWAQVNVDIDQMLMNLERPVVVYTLPASGTLDVSLTRGRAYDYPTTLMSFFTPSDFDFDGVANNDSVENMKRLALKFINAVNESGEFEAIEGPIGYRVHVDYLDANVTGVSIEITLKEREGIRMCDDSMRRDAE